MPTIGTNSKPAYVYDAGTDTWIPIGPGEHTHDYIGKDVITTTGDIIYASAANTPARRGIGSTGQVLTVSGGLPVWAAAAAPSYVGCQLRTGVGTSITIANGTNVTLNWESENFDTNSFHDNVTNRSRITIPSGKAGKYLVKAAAYWEGSPISDAVMLRIYVNGSQRQITQLPKPNANQVTTVISVTMDLVVGDYLELIAYQNSGSNLLINYDSTYTFFGVDYLGA